MADILFSAIESALVTRIDSAMPYLAQCSSYAGQIEDVNNGLPVEAPACFVMFDGFRIDYSISDSSQRVGLAEYSVVVVGDSYVGDTNNRTETYGAYSLVDAVITAVDDNSLSITGFPGLSVSAVEMIRVDKLRAVYRVRFEAQIAITR